MSDGFIVVDRRKGERPEDKVPSLAPSRGVHLWLPNITQRAIAAGIRYELQEDRCNAAYDEVVAPKCPACGVPVADKDWDRHKYEEHNGNQVCQPYGKADSREVLFLGASADFIEQKKAIWRDRHPGLTLELAAEGKEPRFANVIFQRYRVCTSAGKPVE